MPGITENSALSATPAQQKSVSPDLLMERSKCSFDPQELGRAIYGRETSVKLKTISKLISKNPLFDTSDLWYISREERYIQACARAQEFVEICRRYDLMKDPDGLAALEIMAGEDYFVMLHLTMFIPTLENLADEEQRREWLTKARDFRILGTYAQTELGHGSNVAALQTRAVLDFETDEWVINTPNLEATKWWPGGLGKSCTHCILMARIIIRGKDHGVHAFLLPVRNLNTHKSLPGIHLMDVGQKMGYNGMDNGGMRLTNVRIPRNYMLQQYAQVLRDGTFQFSGNMRMLYATMTFTRKQMIMLAGPSLAKAVVICTRYSAVRRQFPEMTSDLPKDLVALGGLRESQVLDYTTQQYAIFPLMAIAVGFTIVGRSCARRYDEMIMRARKGDFSLLNELHITTSALKSTMTLTASEGMESCRRALGGHGYLLSSGIPLLYTSYLPQATYEGDHVVLSIQCGRAFLKMAFRKMRGKAVNLPPGCVHQYVVDFDPTHQITIQPHDQVDFNDTSLIINMFKQRTCALVYASTERMTLYVAEGLKPLQALDEEKIVFTKIARAHCQVLVLEALLEAQREAVSFSPTVGEILKQCLQLCALFWIENHFSEFITSKAMDSAHYNSVMAALKAKLRLMRPEIVGMADAWGFSDTMLNSVMGRFDGRVYEGLYEAAKREPLNRCDVTEGYYRYIQYILHPERKAEAQSKGSLVSRL